MSVVKENGLVWVYEIRNGWYSVLRPLPMAKSVDDPQVMKYLKEVGLQPGI